MFLTWRHKANVNPNINCYSFTFRSASCAFFRWFSADRRVWVRERTTSWPSFGEKMLVFFSRCWHKSSTCLLKYLDCEDTDISFPFKTVNKGGQTSKHRNETFCGIFSLLFYHLKATFKKIFLSSFDFLQSAGSIISFSTGGVVC